MKKLATLLIVGLISVTSSASNWVLGSRNSIGKVYVHTDSILNSGDYKASFIKFVLAMPDSLSFSDDYDTMITFTEYDCKS